MTRKILMACCLVTVAFISFANATMTMEVDVDQNKVTFTVDGDDSISAMDHGVGQGVAFRQYDGINFRAGNSTSISIITTSGVGFTVGNDEFEMNLFAPESPLTRFGGIGFWSYDRSTVPTNWQGTITATFSDLSRFASADDYTTTSSATWGSSTGDIDITYVPEPATMALLGLGGLFLRRRRHSN